MLKVDPSCVFSPSLSSVRYIANKICITTHTYITTPIRFQSSTPLVCVTHHLCAICSRHFLSLHFSLTRLHFNMLFCQLFSLIVSLLFFLLSSAPPPSSFSSVSFLCCLLSPCHSTRWFMFLCLGVYGHEINTWTIRLFQLVSPRSDQNRTDQTRQQKKKKERNKRHKRIQSTCILL